VATKKQKREAALAKREAFLESERQRGLEAQKQERIDNNLTRLANTLEEVIGRRPTEDEVMNFIFGDEEDRLRIVNSAGIGV
jgi:hypothetical protein